MFSMLIKHRKGRQMVHLTGSLPTVLFKRVAERFPQVSMAKIFIKRADKKGFIEEDRYRKGIQKFIL